MPNARLVALFISLASAAGSVTLAAEPVSDARKPQVLSISNPDYEDLVQLLDLGLMPNLKSAPDAERLFERLRKRHPLDPRIEMAYSLVLAQLFKPAEADEHLLAANELEPGYFPARQLRIRGFIRDRKYQEAGDLIFETIRNLDARDFASADIAEWIGRIVSCVLGPVGSKGGREQFATLDSRIRHELPPILLVSYERGYVELEREIDDLRASIEVIETSEQAQREGAKEAVQQTQDQVRAQLKKKQDEARKAGKKWDDWLTDETRKLDDTLQEMEKQYLDMDRSATALTSNIVVIRAQMERIRSGQIDSKGSLASLTGVLVGFGSPQFTSSFSLADQLTLLDFQLEQVQQKLALVYAGQQQLARNANATLSSRKAIVQEYQAATGKVMQQMEALKKWDQRAKKQAEDAKKNADKKPASLASLEARIRSLSTYDPYRFDIARARLLSEYTVAPQTSKE